MKCIETNLVHLEIPFTTEQSAQLSRYAQQVVAGNDRVNVTGAADVEAFAAGPLFDALTLLPILKDNFSLVDIGSGGGLPAIPLAILFPQIPLTLVEPRSRRVAFLEEIRSALQLTISIKCTQDRELPAGQWKRAVAQAVFPPAMWMKRAKRLVGDGGVFYVLSSVPITQEMLPTRTQIDLQRRWIRPLDRAERFATRIEVNAD